MIDAERATLLKRFSAQDLEEHKNRIRDRKYGVPVAPNCLLIDFPARVKHAAALIADMAWTVELATGGCFFVTSDNPAFVRNPKRLTDERIHAVTDEGSELGFPLSRDAFLVCRRPDRTPFAKGRASASRVRHLNECGTVLSSHEFVFSPERSEDVASIVAEYSGFRLKLPELDLGPTAE